MLIADCRFLEARAGIVPKRRIDSTQLAGSTSPSIPRIPQKGGLVAQSSAIFLTFYCRFGGYFRSRLSAVNCLLSHFDSSIKSLLLTPEDFAGLDIGIIRVSLCVGYNVIVDRIIAASELERCSLDFMTAILFFHSHTAFDAQGGAPVSDDALQDLTRHAERPVSALVHPLGMIEKQDHARRALKPSNYSSPGATGQPHNVVDCEHGFERGPLGAHFAPYLRRSSSASSLFTHALTVA